MTSLTVRFELRFGSLCVIKGVILGSLRVEVKVRICLSMGKTMEVVQQMRIWLSVCGMMPLMGQFWKVFRNMFSAILFPKAVKKASIPTPNGNNAQNMLFGVSKHKKCFKFLYLFEELH